MQVNPQLCKWLAIVNKRSFGEEFSQVNPQLHTWLRTINENSSKNNIPQNSKKSISTREKKKDIAPSDWLSKRLPDRQNAGTEKQYLCNKACRNSADGKPSAHTSETGVGQS